MSTSDQASETTIEYHVVISYAAPGGLTGDFSATFNVGPGATREALYMYARDEVADKYFNGADNAFTVTGFSVGLNQL